MIQAAGILPVFLLLFGQASWRTSSIGVAS
jgi:hypothetical protein